MDATGADEPLSLPATRHLVVMLTVAFEGEVPELETDLANMSALKAGLKALIICTTRKSYERFRFTFRLHA